MITNSIAHVLEFISQYMALIIAFLLYHWLKEVSSFLSSPHAARTLNPGRRFPKSRSTRSIIREELFILYQWIRRIRKERNLTQEGLAETLDVATRTVQRWERGETRPRPRHSNMLFKLRHGATQEELAKELDINDRTVRRWESGTQPHPRHYSLYQFPFYELKQGRHRQSRPHAPFVPRRRVFLMSSLLFGLFIMIALLVFLILHLGLHAI